MKAAGLAMIFLSAGNSRRRRQLKNPGADAPGFTGVGGGIHQQADAE